MAWVYLDENFPEHPKVLEAGDQAAWLFVAGLCWCRRYGSEGRIPVSAVSRLTSLPRWNAASKRLVDVGLWHREGDHYVVNDWTDWNRTQESRSEAGRKAARARWDAKRNANASESHSDRTPDASESHMPQDALSPPLPTPVDHPASQVTAPGDPAPAGAEDPRIAVAAAKLARADLEAAQARGERIVSPGGFLEHRRRAWLADLALAIAARDLPDADADALAAQVAVVRGVDPPAGEPETRALVARAELNAARARGEACATCDGVGQAEGPDGLCRPCPTCRTVA